MPATDDHKQLSTEAARQGVETGTVRWVLRISLGLAALEGSFFISASSASEPGAPHPGP